MMLLRHQGAGDTARGLPSMSTRARHEGQIEADVGSQQGGDSSAHTNNDYSGLLVEVTTPQE